jgi:Putative peptidoglycan binding domain
MLNVRAFRGDRAEIDHLLDDWLGEETEIDWGVDPAVDARTASGPAGLRATDGSSTGDSYVGHESAADRVIWRRRIIALAVALVVVVAAVALGAMTLGGGTSSSESSAPATITTPAPVIATTPASSSTTAPATTTAQSASQTATVSITLPTTGALSSGSRDSEVKAVQQGLNTLGFDSGSADGVFGPITAKAVIAFQGANGLKTDGIVGPLTVAKLNASLAAQNG